MSSKQPNPIVPAGNKDEKALKSLVAPFGAFVGLMLIIVTILFWIKRSNPVCADEPTTGLPTRSAVTKAGTDLSQRKTEFEHSTSEAKTETLGQR